MGLLNIKYFFPQFKSFSEYIIVVVIAVKPDSCCDHISYWSKYYYFVIGRNKLTKKPTPKFQYIVWLKWVKGKALHDKKRGISDLNI